MIVNILPANGWGAIYKEKGAEFWVPLAGWALVGTKSGVSQKLVGLDADKKSTKLVTAWSNFKRYEART